MTATNHYITGIAIASLVGMPALSIPLAFLSHFVLDALPHFGDDNFKQKLPKFYKVWRVDFILLCLAVIWTIFNAPWWYFMAGFIATTPDIAWIYRFHFLEKHGKYHAPKMNWFNSFHSRIQKFESSSGIYFEMVYGLAVAYLLVSNTI